MSVVTDTIMEEALTRLKGELDLKLNTSAYTSSMNTYPNIYCWGDSFTEGVGAYVMQPDGHNAYMAYSYPAWLGQNYKAINLGARNMGMNSLRAVQGADPVVIQTGFTIPASKDTPVKIATCTSILDENSGNGFTSRSGALVKLNKQVETAGLNPCVISGVEGIIYREIDNSSVSNEASYDYYFKRLENGEAVTVQANAVVETYAMRNYRNGVGIFWIGANGGYTSNQDYVDKMDSMIRYGDYLNYLIIAGSELSDTLIGMLKTAFTDRTGFCHVIVLAEQLPYRGYALAGIGHQSVDTSGWSTTNTVKKAVPLLYEYISGQSGENAFGMHFSAWGYKAIAKLIEEKLGEMHLVNTNEVSNEMTDQYGALLYKSGKRILDTSSYIDTHVKLYDDLDKNWTFVIKWHGTITSSSYPETIFCCCKDGANRGLLYRYYATGQHHLIVGIGGIAGTSDSSNNIYVREHLDNIIIISKNGGNYDIYLNSPNKAYGATLGYGMSSGDESELTCILGGRWNGDGTAVTIPTGFILDDCRIYNDALSSIDIQTLYNELKYPANEIVATTSGAGLMSAADKTKLDGLDGSTYALKNNTILTNSLSLGRVSDTTIGTGSVALGINNTASANASFAEGASNVASDYGAHAEGANTTASGYCAHAEGNATRAIGSYAHAEGAGSSNRGALSTAAHSEGYYTTANGLGAHAEGSYTTANGEGAHSEGNGTTANNTYAHAEGYGTNVTGSAAHAEGYYTVAAGQYAHAEGNGYPASTKITYNGVDYSIGALGTYSHIEGYHTSAQDAGAHAEGSNTLALGQYSHAEGYSTIAANSFTHAEGYLTQASGYSSHAEGSTTTASGSYSHSEGQYTTASGNYSHVSGYNTIAGGMGATSIGVGTCAPEYGSVALGRYNVYDHSTKTFTANTSYSVGDTIIYNNTFYYCTTAHTTDSTPTFSYSYWSHAGMYALQVGDGTSDSARSNAFAVAYGGDGYFKGDVYVNCNSDSTGGNKVATEQYISQNIVAVEPYKTITPNASSVIITDGADGLAVKELEIRLEPKQDLHEYTKPWVAGAGKNKAVLDADEMRSRYSSWNSGDSVLINGITYTLKRDNDDNIIGINADGTATADASLFITVNVVGDYKFIGCPSDGSASKYNVYMWDATANARPKKWDGTTGSENDIDGSVFREVKFASEHATYIVCRVMSGQTVSNILFKPMVCASTETDITFAPYENKCSITGWTGANVTTTGKNLFDKTNVTNTYITSDGTVTANTNARTSDYIEVKTPCVFHATRIGDPSDSQLRVATYDENKHFIERITSPAITSGLSSAVVTGNNVKYVRVTVYIAAHDIDTAQLELGSTATTYEPYSGTVYPITLSTATNGNSTAGTVYGGNLVLNRDGSGSIYVDIGIHTCTGTEATWGTNTTANSYYRAMSDANEIIACNWLSSLTSGQSTNMPSWTARMNGNHLNLLIMLDSNYDTLDKAKALMASNNLQVVFTLQHPITYELTATQVQTLLGYNYIYTDGGTITELSYAPNTANLMTAVDKIKLDNLATVASTGYYTDLLGKPDLSQYLTSVPTMTGCSDSAAGLAGMVPAPSAGDENKFLSGDGTWKAGGLPMVILSYGNSTWQSFIDAYKNNVIVYCRASSNSNPATGSQTRMAFMAYVSNATDPTNVEFQYYRSMSSHSATQMGDQVYVYKLDKNSGWSVTVREASLKQVTCTATGIQATWSNNILTIADA